MDELVEAAATALDEALRESGVFTMTHSKDYTHVELVDGDVDTPDLMRDVLNKLHERGWHFSKGTTCPS